LLNNGRVARAVRAAFARAGGVESGYTSCARPPCRRYRLVGVGKVRVKICGISNREDACEAVRAGADALGFLVGLLYPTDDELTPEAARDLVCGLPPFVSSVLVTHRSNGAEVADLVGMVLPTTLQLHGPFSVADVQALRQRFPYLKILKAIHVVGEDAVEAAQEFAPFVDAVLLDTKTLTRLGGTGKIHDWSISQRIRRSLGAKPVVLAGGLRPGNVRAAIETVAPYGVDVNTGVSERPGKKSASLLEQFVAAAKGYPDAGESGQGGATGVREAIREADHGLPRRLSDQPSTNAR
jgi:phosphoribosylanthranilate isomerase